MPTSCILLKISEIDGSNSIRQNIANKTIIDILNGFIGEEKPNRLKRSKPINFNIIIALGSTPSQNSLREERPPKSNARVKNNLKAVIIVIP